MCASFLAGCILKPIRFWVCICLYYIKTIHPSVGRTRSIIISTWIGYTQQHYYIYFRFSIYPVFGIK